MAYTREQLENFTTMLSDDEKSTRDDLEAINRDLENLADDDDTEGGVPTNHMADEGSDVYERERLLTVRAEMEERLALIEDAQQRIADGSYGTCQLCGEEINPERLEAMPFVVYCIDCQRKVEQGTIDPGVKDRQPLSPPPGG